MHDRIPSKTAFRVAIRRAIHQLIDHPRVLEDPFALPILGEETASALRAAPEQFEKLGTGTLRAFVVARSRFAEDQLALAVQRGVRQCVVLGAGLDTFAYRNPFPQLTVIEIDHPATQAWKRSLLADAGIATPSTTSYVAVDFAKQTLADALSGSAFRFHEPAFFPWLGVVPYLTREAALGTLHWIGSLARGTAVVFDYAVSRHSLNFLERAALDRLSQRVARAGEPFQLFFEPRELASNLRAAGLQSIEDLSADEMNNRYFINRTDGLMVKGNLGRLAAAWI
jgi:methyltransferase (TIGR00027 family)